jgi:hypothetical protein
MGTITKQNFDVYFKLFQQMKNIFLLKVYFKSHFIIKNHIYMNMIIFQIIWFFWLFQWCDNFKTFYYTISMPKQYFIM